MPIRCWRSLLTASVVALLCVEAFAQENYRAHPIYLEENPRPDFTSSTVRDTEGFLWIATDNGLKRYDGYNLRVFTHHDEDPHSLGSSITHSLMVSRSGVLWVVGNQLSRYNPDQETFTNYDILQRRSGRAIYEDQRGYLWIGGDGFGVVQFDPATERVINRYFEQSPRGEVRDISGSARGDSFWVASSGGVYRMSVKDGKNFRLFPLKLDFVPGTQSVRAVQEDHTGKLWVSSDSGLITVNPETGKAFRYTADPDKPGSLVTNNLWALFQDSKHRLWIGTDKKGLHYYRPESDDFAHYPEASFTDYSLPPGSIIDIYEDDEHNLWLSASAYGVFRISPSHEKFTSYKHSLEIPNALNFNNLLEIQESHDGKIWIATDGGGLNQFDPLNKTFKAIENDPDNPNSISSNSLLALEEDTRGNLWIGTWGGGLNRLDIRSGMVSRIIRKPQLAAEKTLASNNIFRVESMRDGRLLISTWGRGFQIYDPNSKLFESYSPYDLFRAELATNYAVNDFLYIDDSEIWIGGYNGLELFDARNKKFWKPSNPINSSVFDIFRDDQGNLWLGTDSGLTRYRPVSDSLTTYTDKDGLPDNFVVSIEQDNNGYLWIGTRNGLSKFDPRSEHFENFTELDGLAGAQFNRSSHLYASDGMMYFGTTTGLTVFDPENLPVNENAPPVHFTGLELFQEPVQPGKTPWLKAPLNRTEHLILPYEQRDITFRFTALNLISPQKNRFRYRLKGWQNDWQETDSSGRRVRYTNLAPGNYQFQILSANNEGVWNSKARLIELTIKPPWWRTWWAMVFYGMCCVLVIFGFSQWRVRANRQREKELQGLVDQQTAQLRFANQRVVQLNSELEQRVAHRTQELSIEIEERRESEARSQYIAYHDSLTGLKNRVWLLDHLQKLIDKGQLPFALLYIGGDRFRKINDSHGHLVGDKLLAAAAQRLNRLLQNKAVAVRLGSDEFAVIFNTIENENTITETARHIIESFKDKFVIDQLRINFSVSIGILIADKKYSEATQLIRNANIAMQRAKERGRAVYQLFDNTILKTMLDQTLLEVDLRRAMGNGEFSVVYQPIININSQYLSSFELLLRWHHPQRGMVPPDRFIAIAESIGLIFEIGIWVLHQACLQIKQWQSEFKTQDIPAISVNLSPLQLGQVDLLQRIDEVFEETHAPHDKIRFEITESALMQNTDTVEMLLEGLRQRGLDLAIDDFGTGYSSLAYLDRLPVQQLKIDRAFVNALESNQETGNAHEIVRATINLAHNLKMRVVAEGIETSEQLNTLEQYNCDYGQGFFIAKPMIASDAREFLIKDITRRSLSS